MGILQILFNIVIVGIFGITTTFLLKCTKDIAMTTVSVIRSLFRAAFA